MDLVHYLIPVTFFRWCQSLGIAQSINNSQWDFAILETFHIMGIAVLLGSTLVVDLRLLGVGMRRRSVGDLYRELEPWTLAAIAFVFLTGIVMFLSEAVRMGFNTGFFWKMIFLTIAVVIHFTIHRKAARQSGSGGGGMGLAKVTAWLSLLSWLSVALAGRSIAFLQVLNSNPS